MNIKPKSCCTGKEKIHIRKPAWLRQKLPTGPEYENMRRLIKKSNLATVCQQAQCPNQFECFAKGTATFMILGERCTRNCRFCAVGSNPSGPPDADEPQRVAEAIQTLGLKYAVITSVTRDDLPDGGAAHFAATLEAIHCLTPKVKIELLIPDLQGDWDDLATILNAKPDILNHNIETVPALYSRVRPQAIYKRSLELFTASKKIAPTIPTKSGIMLGLGESRDELLKAMDDLLSHHCEMLTLGQYLQPSAKHLSVERFVPPEEFAELKEIAQKKGFKSVASGPTVRSSYQAEQLFSAAENI